MSEHIKSGQLIDDKYEIVKLIGEGGMSYVYMAKDLESKSDVAIKFLKHDITSSYVEDNIRFQREIKAVSKLNHPDILKIYFSGSYDNTPYIVMELIKGESLHDYLAAGKSISQNDSIKIIKSLSAVLSYVHSQNLLHRDIKPGNIMVIKEHDSFKVKLLDFGIALVMELKNITDEKEIIGTFGYMSPEATGILKKRVDERSDLYSLGVVFYKLLTGKSPFKSTNLRALLHEQVTSNLISPSKHDEKISSIISDIVMKLLEKEQDYRYQSAKGLSYDLERVLDGEKKIIIGQKDQKIKLTYQTRLVGRDEELNKIKSLIDDASSGNGGLCLISGEPGAGKSRLVEAVKEYVYEQGYDRGGLFLEGRAVSQSNKIPYQPFKDALNEYVTKFEKLDTYAQQAETARLRNIVGELGEIITKLNPNMHTVLGDIPSLVRLEPERENQRFLMVLSNFFLHLADKNQACILYLDDLQWADEGTLRLIEELTEKIENSNLIILGTYRVNEVDASHSLFKIIEKSDKNKRKLGQISVKLFDIDKMVGFVSGILGQEEKSSLKLGSYLLEKSGGNPFFAVTILREIVEYKAVEWKNGCWKEDWDKIKDIKISGSVIEIILRRIKDLSKKENKLLCISAIIGITFEVALLSDLVEYEYEEMINVIDGLITKQIIEESSEKGKLIFVHDRLREAFLKKVGKKEARAIHYEVALQIEKINKDNLDNVSFNLAYHYAEAGDKVNTLKHTIPAGIKAKDKFANDEAEKYLLLGIKILEEMESKGSESWLKAVDNLSQVYLVKGKTDEAIEVLNNLFKYDIAWLEKPEIHKRIGDCHFKQGNYPESEKSLAKALTFYKIKLPVKLSSVIFAFIHNVIKFLLYSIFPFLFIKKNPDKIKSKYKKIIEIYFILNYMYAFYDVIKTALNIYISFNLAFTKLGKNRYLALMYIQLGTVFGMFNLDYFSGKYLRKAYVLLDNIGDKANYYYFNGAAKYMLGKHYLSIESEKKSLKLNRAIGDLWNTSININIIGHSQRYLGNYEESIKCFEEYLEISKKINDYYSISSCLSYLALAYVEKGNYDKAFELNKQSLEISSAHDIKYNICFSNIHMGYLYREQGELDNALIYLERAKKLFDKIFFMQDWTTIVYHHVADTYIEKYKIDKDKLSKKEKRTLLKKIKWLSYYGRIRLLICPNHYCAALRVLGKYNSIINKKRKAKKYFLKSMKNATKYERKYEVGRSLYEYGVFLNEIKKENEAVEQWQKAYEVFKQIGAKVYIKRCEKLLGIKTEVETEDEISPQERLRLERRMNTALDTGRYLSSILILDDLLEKIMDKTIELVGAERGLLFLYPESEKGTKLKAEAKILRNIKSEGIDISSIKDGILPIVEKNKKPLISADASIDINISEHSMSSSTFAKNLKSVLCAPIVTKGNLLGMIYLDNHLVAELFSDEDLNVLNLIASQAGVSIENARLYQNLQEQERLKKEMEIAERIQTAIVPEPPEHKELEISVVMQPAEEVGGDYYDIIYDNHDNLWFAIGDVSGHGVTPGLIMMMAQSSFSSYIKDDKSITPKDAIAKVNDILTENIRVRLKEIHFMTMSFIKYLGKGKFVCSNAGHPEIIVYRAKAKKSELIKVDGVYLGIKPDISSMAQDVEFKLDSGDIMILYTDGVIESRHRDDRKCMGMDRLQNIIIENASKSLDDLKSVVLERTLDWCGNRPADDITMVFVKMK